MRHARSGFGLVLVIALGCAPPAPAPELAAPEASRLRDVSGRLLYRDGSPAEGAPYELVVLGRSHANFADASGRLSASAILPASERAVTLRSLDGYGLGLDADIDGSGEGSLRVAPSKSGRLPDAYLLDTGKAMVLVTVPESPSGEVARAITRVDMVGVHGRKELMTLLGPRELAALRALGLEVLVLDVDANAFAAKTSEMTSNERTSYIDARIARARSRLRRTRPGQ